MADSSDMETGQTGLTGRWTTDTVRSCRVCGCTDNDCRSCIERTGQPCRWIETDLCSACQTPETKATASRPLLRFDATEAQTAASKWGLNCGPAAIAAVLGLTLDELRPQLLEFEALGYTNPTLMLRILDGLQVDWRETRYSPASTPWRVTRHGWPGLGLARIQWDGPWMGPKVPIAARYRQSHWVAAHRDGIHVHIFDINCIRDGGWVPQDLWSDIVVPLILRECVPRANGGWHITHAIEILGRKATAA